MCVTPASREGSARTVSCIRRRRARRDRRTRRCRPTSMRPSASRLPRMVTSTDAGVASAKRFGARFRKCTGLARSLCSSGAGTICTETAAVRRTSAAATDRRGRRSHPRRSGCRAPPTSTGSVSASVTRWTADAGPITSTERGFDRPLGDDESRRGPAIELGTIGTDLDADVSNAIAMLGGVTCNTWMPNGARTWSGPRWKSRWPGRAPRRSSTATTSPGETRLSDPEVPRTRTSMVAGISPCSSRPAGNLLELERHAKAALNRLFTGDGHPQQQREAERQHLQPEVAERPHRCETAASHVYSTSRLRGRSPRR